MNSFNNLSNKINDMHKVICMHSNNIINNSDNDEINNSINTTPTYSYILRINNNGPTSTSSIYNEQKSQSKAVNLIPSKVIEHLYM